ncbi:hypothetical protein ACA910_018171 [Epithemia clementina (nom. ined.)]
MSNEPRRRLSHPVVPAPPKGSAAPSAAASSSLEKPATTDRGQQHHHAPSTESAGTTSGAGVSRKRGREGAPVLPNTTATPTATPGRLSPVPDTLLQTAIAQASQVCSKLGYFGLAQLLMVSSNTIASSAASSSNSAAGSNAAAAGSSSNGNSSTGGSGPSSFPRSALPTIAQVHQAANKAHQEQPPWIHWNKSDMAQSAMRVTSANRLELQANLSSSRAGNGGGYRMARANVGCSSGSHYFELWILEPPPTTQEILQALPPSIRLAPKLRRSLQAALEHEEKEQAIALQQEQQVTKPPHSTATVAPLNTKSEGSSSAAEESEADAYRKLTGTNSSSHRTDDNDEARMRVGGHFRVGWSMRTGELQAPVGYDRWSFAIRDIGGSIITNSKRIDNWNGADGFGPGDVIGCAICLFHNDDDNQNGDKDSDVGSKNHIRFFKNGVCMGEFVIAKGKRSGGEAPFQCEIPAGTYYPAVSCYMGGAIRANFGPKFVYPPRKLPAGLKLTPLSELSPPPETNPQNVMLQMTPILKLLRSGGSKHVEPFQQILLQAVQTEARIINEFYENHQRQNLLDIRQERLDRGLAVQDLDALLEEQTKESQGFS